MKKPVRSRAFAPANASLIFQTYPGKIPSERGSLGVGFTIDRGVIAEAALIDRSIDRSIDTSIDTSTAPSSPFESTIHVAGQAWEFPTVRSVLDQLNAPPVALRIEADFPFGCGFGMSGASALAVAFAVNDLCDLDYTAFELAQIAHMAEVFSSTGLGDVGGQFNGGLMVKTKPGYPLRVERLPIPTSPLYIRIFGPIETKSVIDSPERLEEINRAGGIAMQDIQDSPGINLDRLIKIACDFAASSGLMQSDKVRQVVKDVEARGGQATMIMLGEAVVSTIPFPGCKSIRISAEGVRML